MKLPILLGFAAAISLLCGLPAAAQNGQIGSFQPNSANVAQTTATTSSAPVRLPGGVVVLIQNVGSTNGLYARLGTSNAVTATSKDIYIGPSSGCVVSVGPNTYIGLLSASSTTLVNLNGGSGIGSCPTGGGGGSGGGGGGNVTITAPIGRAADASSVSAALSNEDYAAITAPVPACAANPCVTTIGNTGQNAVIGGNTVPLISCQSSVIYDASTSGSTQLVALASGQTVRVCGYSIIASGTVNVGLTHGTGTACAAGTTKVTPAFQLTAQAGLVDHAPYWQGLATAASDELCINTSGGVAVQAIVYYTQY